MHAQKSKTLRRKIKEENPDNLEFREKVLKFTAAAIESKEKPKAPEPLAASKNMFVVKGKEVAFGAINIEQKMLAGSEIDLEDDLVGESVQIESDITIAALSAKKELDSIKRAENLKENAKNLERANELKRQEAAARVVTKQRNQAGCKIKELESKGLRIEREINRLRNRAADEDNGQEVEALREEEEQLMDELNEITDQLEQAKLEEENTE